jgi:hypothetical protein
MVDTWTADYSEYITGEYDGIIYMKEETALKHLYQARLHEKDNEYLKTIYIKEV